MACSAEEASAEVEGASVVDALTASVLDGKTLTEGRRPGVKAEPLVVVSVVWVGSKMTVLEMMMVVTLPSARVAVDNDTAESEELDSANWVEAIVGVGGGDSVIDGTTEEGFWVSDSVKLVRKSPKEELKEVDVEGSKGVL